ncbi:MAG: ribosome-associated translation inhibitor RaiA [Candidatus Kerfeldbacteria bacterium]|nr:ribosome-associated translation inhibitor RaiA [Candidatus Kerfeldbacteria bacterium]
MIPITISAKDFKLTPALKSYVNDKLGRLARLSPSIERIGVELDVDRHHHQGRNFRVEVWIYLPRRTIAAGLKAEDMRAAIDLVCPRLERRIVRYKDRLVSRRRRASRQMAG